MNFFCFLHLLFLSPAVRGSQPPIQGQSLLTFHSADTDCIFKCAAIPDVLSTKLAVQKFINQREFCFTGFTAFCHIDTPCTAVNKKSRPLALQLEPNSIASVFPCDPDTPSVLHSGSYRAVKLENILILQKHKLFQQLEALYMLTSDSSTINPEQLPNVIRFKSSVDCIHDSACKLAHELTEMRRLSSRLEGDY